MAKMVVEDVGEFYQHYPKVACVIAAHWQGKDNAMVAAWHTSLSFSPPLYGVSLAAKRFTYRLIVQSKEFGVNFLPFSSAELIAAIGGSSGSEVDKFQKFNIATDRSIRTGAPILRDAYAAYECRLVDDRAYGDHRLLVGEIVAVHTQEGSFTTKGTLDLRRVSPTLYLGNELYATAPKGRTRRLDRKIYASR